MMQQKKTPLPYTGRQCLSFFLWSSVIAGLLLAHLPACTGPVWEIRYQKAVAEIAPSMEQNCVATAHYRVCGDADSIPIDALGTFMEQAATSYDRVLGRGTTASLDPAVVWLYTDPRRYRQVAAGLGFHRSIPAFFSPVTPAAIHVRWDGSDE
ncbi:MAG: hypothetical protein ACOZBW_13190, partial [Thermodesulfobacteriota bacterium]